MARFLSLDGEEICVALKFEMRFQGGSMALSATVSRDHVFRLSAGQVLVFEEDFGKRFKGQLDRMSSSDCSVQGTFEVGG
jgi:hypothetical protein